jgi:hypothetical protein
MLNSGVALLLAKDRAAELQREADRHHHRRPVRSRTLELLLRRRGASRTSSR